MKDSARSGRPEDELGELIRRAQDGDLSAMEAVYRRFKTPLFNLAYRYTFNRAAAEDLLHDIFIKIFNHIHTIDRNRAFVAWIYRVAVNTCLSHLRSRRSRPLISVDEMENIPGTGDGCDSVRVSNRPLDEAIRNLPGKLKSVFLLHDVQGYKHEEIAEIMGWSIGTSKSQLFKARMRIRERLHEVNPARGEKG